MMIKDDMIKGMDRGDEPTKDELQRIQSQHLTEIEFWGKNGYELKGVKLFQIMSYDLVQIVNQLWLQERLNGS